MISARKDVIRQMHPCRSCASFLFFASFRERGIRLRFISQFDQFVGESCRESTLCIKVKFLKLFFEFATSIE